MVYFHPDKGATPPHFRHIPLSFFRIPLGLIERCVCVCRRRCSAAAVLLRDSRTCGSGLSAFPRIALQVDGTRQEEALKSFKGEGHGKGWKPSRHLCALPRRADSPLWFCHGTNSAAGPLLWRAFADYRLGLVL